MSSTPQQMIIEAFNQLATFRTQSASEMERHLASDSEMWQSVGLSIVAFADSVQTTMPYGPATCDGLRDLGAAALAIGQMSQQVYQTFRSEHEEKLQRVENPMAEEEQWDVGGGRQS